jgi:Methyltransferase domain
VRGSCAPARIAGVTDLRDYEKWLEAYDDPDSPLSWRLRQVQQWLRRELDARPGPFTVLSFCAGDGRDLIDVLADRSDADRVRGVLVELHPPIAERARERARAAGLTHVEVRTADAADTSAYADVVPADVVLLVGVFGNISSDDLRRTIAASPQLCRQGATLVWSRGRDQDDLNDEVRAAFRTAGFSELDYAELDAASRPALGAVRYDGPPVDLVPEHRLFTFWR